MTVLVGIRCTDGVVIGADSVGTSAMGPMPLLQMQSNDKIQIFGGRVIVAATGAVGLSQRLMTHVEGAIGNKALNNTLHQCTGEISSRFVIDCNQTGVPRLNQGGLGFGALFAAFIQGEPQLVEFASTDFQAEAKTGNIFTVCMGSGQLLAEPFLNFVCRVLWKGKPPKVSEAKFGVYWALNHTIELAPGGVGAPIRMASLQKTNGNWKAEEIQDMQEAAEYIAELESYIGDFARKTLENAPTTAPPTPPAKV